MIRREYFNRWYSLKSYYAALTLATLPVMVRLFYLKLFEKVHRYWTVQHNIPVLRLFDKIYENTAVKTLNPYARK